MNYLPTLLFFLEYSGATIERDKVCQNLGDDCRYEKFCPSFLSEKRIVAKMNRSSTEYFGNFLFLLCLSYQSMFIDRLSELREQVCNNREEKVCCPDIIPKAYDSEDQPCTETGISNLWNYSDNQRNILMVWLLVNINSGLPVNNFTNIIFPVFEKFDQSKVNYPRDEGSTAACVALESCPSLQGKRVRAEDSELDVEVLRSRVCNRKLKKVCCQQIRFSWWNP